MQTIEARVGKQKFTLNLPSPVKGEDVNQNLIKLLNLNDGSTLKILQVSFFCFLSDRRFSNILKIELFQVGF